MSDRKLPTRSTDEEVQTFLRKVASTPKPVPRARHRGRLLFAMDATASREPTWDRACHLQAEMFDATADLGGLDVQLCYYRGFNEFSSTGWVGSPKQLLSCMTRVRCVGGMTQIERVLEHCVEETNERKVNALVFVGDCMEEDVDRLCHHAGKLGLLGVPCFIFQEGHDPLAERAFRTVAKLSGGASCRFDRGSAEQLRSLLTAVAVYAAGGRRALEDFSTRQGEAVRQLTRQLER